MDCSCQHPKPRIRTERNTVPKLALLSNISLMNFVHNRSSVRWSVLHARTALHDTISFIAFLYRTSRLLILLAAHFPTSDVCFCSSHGRPAHLGQRKVRMPSQGIVRLGGSEEDTWQQIRESLEGLCSSAENVLNRVNARVRMPELVAARSLEESAHGPFAV